MGLEIKKKLAAVKENKGIVKEQIKKKGKLFFFIGAILAAIVIVLNVIQVGVVTKMARDAIEKESHSTYKTVVSQSRGMIENKLETYFAELNYYAKNDIILEEDSDVIWEWLKQQPEKREGIFDYIGWCDKDGKFRTDINTTSTISDRDYWQAIMLNGADVFIDDPVLARSSGKVVVHICKAAKVNGKTIGFFCGVVAAEHMNKFLDGMEMKTAGTAVLFDSKGGIMATTGDKNAFAESLEKLKEKNLDDYNEIEQTFGSDQPASFGIKDARGKGQWVISEPLNYAPWSFAVFLNESKIYSTAYLVAKILSVSGTLIIALIIVITASILFWSLKPLAVVEKTIRGIASGDADLTKRIEINANNEIGGVVEGFNQFAEKLQTIIATMKTSKDSLVDAGRLLTDSTSDTSAAITQIIANIESMGHNVTMQTDSVHQTAGAVNEIASNIESLNRMIESQTTSVSQASAAVEQMIGNINSVNTSVRKMAEAFDELEQKAQTGVQKQNDVNAKISEIETESQALQEANTVISGIAEQTNLLAMNAAIEAAHAGEAGKGFSVVADEIRKLSEDSSSQSQTIGTQLSRITATIEEIVLASQIAADAFTEVCTGIDTTNNLVTEITNAMAEQNEGSKQISIALQTVNDTSNEVKTASFEMSEGNKAILTEVKALQDATFSIKDGMDEMSAGARKINETGAALSDISRQMDSSIQQIGEQVDQFKV
ncbi:MAG: HAMP domain-containing protein [Treponema sp.]|nr:HAMP domain-containing protein [Treponema sp.]